MSAFKITQLSILTTSAILLFTVESLIPMPFPWMKLGLANLVTLFVLLTWDLKYAFIVVVLRVVIGNLILGKLFTPAFILSLGGGVGATLGMFLLLRYFNKPFSLIGISVFGAFMHNLVQLLLANLIFIHQGSLYYLAPVLTLSAILTGSLIGLLVQILMTRKPVL